MFATVTSFFTDPTNSVGLFEIYLTNFSVSFHTEDLFVSQSSHISAAYDTLLYIDSLFRAGFYTVGHESKMAPGL